MIGSLEEKRQRLLFLQQKLRYMESKLTGATETPLLLDSTKKRGPGKKLPEAKKPKTKTSKSPKGKPKKEDKHERPTEQTPKRKTIRQLTLELTKKGVEQPDEDAMVAYKLQMEYDAGNFSDDSSDFEPVIHTALYFSRAV